MDTERRSAVVADILLAVAAFAIDGLAFHGDTTVSGGRMPAAITLVLTAVCAATLMVRRRLPLVPFAVWCVYGLTPLLVLGREPFAGLCICVATVAARRTLRVAVAAMIIAALPFGLNAYSAVRAGGRGDAVDTALLATPFWLALPVVAWGIGRVIKLLRDQQDLQQRLHAVELSGVIREERLRLARDLHDIVAHSVSAMILQAAGARSLDADADARVKAALRSIETTGADAMKELHRLLGLLRTPTDEPPPLTAQPGLGDVDRVIETTRSCGVEVEVIETGQRRPLDPEVSYTAFRMVQECMANVIKHGGAGARSTLAINWRDDGVDLTIRNDEHDAVTASMLSGGYGLRGLSERVEHVGGRFDAGPREESIFVASASLPLRPRAVAVGG